VTHERFNHEDHVTFDSRPDSSWNATVLGEFEIKNTSCNSVRKITLHLRTRKPVVPENMEFYVPMSTEYDRVAELAVMRFGHILKEHLEEKGIL